MLLKPMGERNIAARIGNVEAHTTQRNTQHKRFLLHRKKKYCVLIFGVCITARRRTYAREAM